MRIRLLLALLALPAAAAAQPPADPVPLRPGTVGISVGRADYRWLAVTFVRAGSPAAAAGLSRDCVLEAIDGRSVDGWSEAHVQTALAGPIGSTVEVTVRRGRERRTVRVARADLLAPGPGYTEMVETRRLVVHHRDVPGEARRARALARGVERKYAKAGLPADTEGRRAHLWFRSDTHGPWSRGIAWDLPAWAAHVSADWASVSMMPDPIELSLTYPAYGDPGRAGSDAFTQTDPSEAARLAHLSTARQLLAIESGPPSAAAETTAVAPPGWAGPEVRKRFERYGSGWGNHEARSLMDYVIERFGVQRFRRLWQSDLEFHAAVPQALGIPAGTLLRDWQAYVMKLGPDPAARVSTGTVAVTLGWGALLLLYGVRVARRKEVV